MEYNWAHANWAKCNERHNLRKGMYQCYESCYEVLNVLELYWYGNILECFACNCIYYILLVVAPVHVSKTWRWGRWTIAPGTVLYSTLSLTVYVYNKQPRYSCYHWYCTVVQQYLEPGTKAFTVCHSTQYFAWVPSDVTDHGSSTMEGSDIPIQHILPREWMLSMKFGSTIPSENLVIPDEPFCSAYSTVYTKNNLPHPYGKESSLLRFSPGSLIHTL